MHHIFTDYKVGDRIRIIANTGSHNYTVGTIYQIANVNRSGSNLTVIAKNPVTGVMGNNLPVRDCEPARQTREHLTDKKKSLEKQLVTINAHLQFMFDHDLKEFDIMEMQVMEMIDVMDRSGDPLERAKKIVEIIRKA